jgi:hypothetical protein
MTTTKDPQEQYLKLIGIIDQARYPGESSIDCLNRIIVGDGYNINVRMNNNISQGELRTMKGWLWQAIEKADAPQVPPPVPNPLRESLILAYKLGSDGILPTEEILQRWLNLVNP